jgi:hypothetical protein
MHANQQPDGDRPNGDQPARKWPNDPSDPGFDRTPALDGSGRRVFGAKNRSTANFPFCQTTQVGPNGR